MPRLLIAVTVSLIPVAFAVWVIWFGGAEAIGQWAAQVINSISD